MGSGRGQLPQLSFVRSRGIRHGNIHVSAILDFAGHHRLSDLVRLHTAHLKSRRSKPGYSSERTNTKRKRDVSQRTVDDSVLLDEFLDDESSVAGEEAPEMRGPCNR